MLFGIVKRSVIDATGKWAAKPNILTATHLDRQGKPHTLENAKQSVSELKAADAFLEAQAKKLRKEALSLRDQARVMDDNKTF